MKVKDFIYLLFALPLLSCESVTCPINNTVACVYGFYASARTSDGTFVEGAAISIGDTLTITAMGADSVIANRLINKNGVSLPVSFYGDTDSLMFTFIDAQGAVGRDTIRIDKTNRAHLDDPSCPLHMWHTITAVQSTRHLIDTVLINHSDINYDGLENLQIYFRTAQ